jgi:hypothetical protein
VNVTFKDKTVVIDGTRIELQWPVLDAFELGERVIVLFDPDGYLLDPGYKAQRRQGREANRNLCAFTKSGEKVWEAEFPEEADYYYAVNSRSPLRVNSFSSFRCEIDACTGKIKSKTFLK